MVLTTSWQTVATQAVTSGAMTVRFYLDARYDDIKNSTANNESYIYTRLRSVLEYGSGSGTGYSFSCSYCTSISGSEIWYFGNETILESSKTTITHNTDGTKSLTLTATAYNKYLGINVTLSGDVTLNTIPRYATSNQSLNSKTETTITMNWSSDNTIDYLWYSKDGGTNWTGVDVTDGTSGTYKISGLTANNTYSIKTRVRRKDSQLTTDSSALSVTTYKVPSNSLNARTETTIKMNWSVDSTADYIWYSKDNGSTWTAVGSVSATSGTYTISGLSANTAYKVKTRVRRKATQTTYDASAVSVTTYNYPHITAVGTSNLTIGNSQKLTLYNPLSRTVTIKMYQTSTSGTQLYSGTTSSTTITFTPTASTLYASIPSAKSSKCVYSATYSSVTKTTGQYTYTINESACKPTFSNFTYADVDSTVVTENNQILVNGNSDCKFFISTGNKAIAKNSATMVSYKCEYGSVTKTIDYSSNSEVSTWIAGATGGTLKVTAIDSRGLSTTVTKTVPYIAYTSAVVNSVEVQRLNGVDLETYLGLKMTIWKGNWQNGSNTAYDNQLKYVGYRVYDGSSWTSYFDITSAVKSAMSTSTSGTSTILTVPLSKKLAIHADGSSGGFTIGKEYKIQIVIKDGTSTSTFTPYSYQATSQGTVPDGKVGFSRYKDSSGNYHYAINGMPEENENFTVHGSLFIDGTAGSASASTGKIGFGNDGNTEVFLSANTNNAVYFNTSATDNSTQIGYDGANNAFRPSSANITASLGISSAPFSQLYIKKVIQSGHLYLNGIIDNSLDSPTKIIFGNETTNYVNISCNKNKNLFFSTCTTAYENAMGYLGANNAFGPLSSNVTALLGRPAYPWDNVYSNLFTGDLNGGIKNALTEPTSTITYPLVFFGGNTNGTYYDARTTSGVGTRIRQGTTSAEGIASLELGNGIAAGTAGNKHGRLVLYNSSTSYTILRGTSSSTAYTQYLPAENGTVQLKPTTLYSNASGTTGNITLSETAANFNYIEIYYGKEVGTYGYSCQKVPTPNGKRVNLSCNNWYGAGDSFQCLSKAISISGTTLTGSISNLYGHASIWTNVEVGAENAIYIYKVIGYK